MSVTSHPLVVAGVSAGDGSSVTLEIRAHLDSLLYLPDGTAPYDGGATLKLELLGTPLAGSPWTSFAEVLMSGVVLGTAATWRPRRPATDSSGAAIAGSAELIGLPMAALRVTVTNGGNGNTGHFLVIYQQPT